MHDDRRIIAAADQLDAAIAHLRETLERLSDEAATKRSPDGGWSPAQIVYHVAITNEGFFQPTFEGSAPFLTPTPGGFSETFSFDTMPAKVKTFPQLEPPAVGKAEALEKLQQTGTAVAAAMRTLPADRLGQCATLPFGTLSMQQMAEFAAGHVLRHQAQLDRAISASA
jgi:hypothetical protein